MKNGKYSSRKASHVKPLVLLLTLALVVGGVVGGTLAWLTAQTEEVENTFTVGNINIDLDESDDLDLKMIPGSDIDKDPVASVLKGSEASWLFVRVEESSNLSDYIEYEIVAGWTEYEPARKTNVKYYYREVEDLTEATEDKEFIILAGNKVHVKEGVTKEMMDSLTAETYPELTFDAAAIQRENIETVKDAWDNLPNDFRA